MPWSAHEGREWSVERITALKPSTILDIGVGSGTYADLLRPHLPEATFIGVEVHAPYVERFGLRAKYDELRVTDVRFMNNLPVVDVVVLGDVLEHLTHPEALHLWWQARASARLGVHLSLPIIDYPQGACEGNEHEAHLVDWTHGKVMSELDGVTDSWTGTIVGRYQAVPS